MLENIKILYHQGKQYIPNLRTVEAPGVFRGRPVISKESVDNEALKECCPTQAIAVNPIQIDLGKCTFCGECAIAFPHKIKFTKDYKIATNSLDGLLVKEGEDKPITLNADLIRAEIQHYFKGSLKLRQVSAGGDGSCELELGACSNVNFDMGRYGIDFVASPRHADGIVITGPITENMAKPLQTAYEAIPEPKIVILCGVDAISGGIFVDSPAINRNILKTLKIDLYVPGNPIHPLTFINGVLDLIGRK
ncbi:MAG: hypothetical protein K0B10_06415 [Vicingaceae bacterium]|nr:hypothetical protein [Vicingaceae bacterium]